MPETLLFFLCDGMWMWDPVDQWFTVNFKSDGTGELYCRVELSLFIAAQFDWRALSNLEVKPSFPTTIDLEMTLTKRNMDVPNPIMRDVLEDAAFQPKTYRLQLERGRFWLKGRPEYGSKPSYEYRLLWDKSPYPPLEEWKYRTAAEACKFWELRDFYRGRIEDSGNGCSLL